MNAEEKLEYAERCVDALEKIVEYQRQAGVTLVEKATILSDLVDAQKGIIEQMQININQLKEQNQLLTEVVERYRASQLDDQGYSDE